MIIPLLCDIVLFINQPSEDRQKGLVQDFFNQPIHFNNVYFAYNDNQNVLKNISFSVQPGKTIVIVGPSGGGKTTLFELIKLFYQPTDGSIKVDNQHIDVLHLYSWRGQIGYVIQENAMMTGIIRENLVKD